MKIKHLQDVELLQEVIDQCRGGVWLESIYGDKYNLKSALSRYIAMADLLRENPEALELFAELPEDQQLLEHFLSTL